MRLNKKRIKDYIKLSAKQKLRFLLEYKIFVKKATTDTDKKLLIMLKKEGHYSVESPPSMMNSE